MKTSSCKAKGRRACQQAKELIEKYHPDLKPGDILITSSGVTGEDLKLSPAARLILPFVIECKNQERLSIFQALKQAQSHPREDCQIPLLCFMKNHTDLYAALKFTDLLKLIS